MKYKNLFSTILGALIMIAGMVAFFIYDFTLVKFGGAELIGLVLFRCWMSKDKTLGLLERLVK
jgi:hypothetical protein